MKTMTVGELIKLLKGYDEDVLVALSTDEEGNGYSVMGNEMCVESCYMENNLGYADEIYFSEDEIEGLHKAIVLYPSC